MEALPEGSINTSPENRRRLSGPGLRTFLNIADHLGLDEEQQRAIAGGPPVADYRDWCRKAREQLELTLEVDVLMRISAVLGIYGSLRTLYKTEQEGFAWLRGPYGSSPFEGRAPIDLVLDGSLEGLMAVRRFLLAVGQGLYMPPNEIDRDFTPYTDDNLIFVDESDPSRC